MNAEFILHPSSLRLRSGQALHPSSFKMDWFAQDTPLIIGHRGASADAPENTLAAFGLATEQGADGIELDVQLSADGWPVVIHDHQVSRTTNGAGVVSKLTVGELQALDAGMEQHVPTLDEVFEMLGGQVLYNIEITDFSLWGLGTETAVADRIQAYHLGNHVLVSSFSPLSVRRARRCLSRATPTALIRSHGWLKYGYLIGDGEADHPHYSLVDEKYMAWARKRGYRVNVWVVDDLAEAQRLTDLGVHAIITSKPGVIRRGLES